MQRIALLLFASIIFCSCGTSRNTSETAARRKQTVFPPQSFIDAIFQHRKTYQAWPTTPAEILQLHGVKKDWQAFCDRGMESLQVINFSRDTLELGFYFSRVKEKAYTGNSNTKLTKRDIAGRYLFIYDNNLVLFKIVLDKMKMFDVKIS